MEYMIFSGVRGFVIYAMFYVNWRIWSSSKLSVASLNVWCLNLVSDCMFLDNWEMYFMLMILVMNGV